MKCIIESNDANINRINIFRITKKYTAIIALKIIGEKNNDIKCSKNKPFEKRIFRNI